MASGGARSGAAGLFRPTVRDDVPAIRAEERPACEAWLRSIGFLGRGRDVDEWEAIKRNWAGFLKATSPPAHGARRTAGSRDHRDRRAIQMAFWDGADGLEGLAERWPAAARRLLTQAAEGPHARPFESLAPKWLLETRRRFQSMWTGLACFLTYSAQHGTLEEMGLSLDEARTDDLFDLADGLATGAMLGDGSRIFDAALELLLQSIMDKEATARTNVILWWTAVLVRSAVSGEDEGEDFIGRGAFRANILPIDTPIHQRVESMMHYSRVFILHQAFHGWTDQAVWRMEIQAELNAVDNSWLNNDSGPRPGEHHDRRTCGSAAWRSMLTHLRSEATAALGGKVGRPMYEVAQLLAQLREARNQAGDAAAGVGAGRHSPGIGTQFPCGS